MKQQYISQFLMANDSAASLKYLLSDAKVNALPQENEGTWLLKDCTRLNAEHLLARHPDGTFLVRPSQTGQYALSIV